MKIIASHLFSSQREIKCITPLEHAPCTLFGLGSTLALLVTSASHIPPEESRLAGPGILAQRWRGIFRRSTVEGAHRLTFVCAQTPSASLSADPALSQAQTHTHTHCICHHTHTHTANSDIKPRPDVGIFSLYRRIIPLSTIWPQAVFCINESQNIVMHYNSITPLHLLNDKREKHAQCIK